MPRRPLLASFALLACPLTCFAHSEFDVEYGVADGVSLKLDIRAPEGEGPFPAVILIHGGGLRSGDKNGGRNPENPGNNLIAPMHDPLIEAGFAYFTINYRLVPAHPMPAAVEDTEQAIRWVKRNAVRYKVDPDRIAISGESAGGYLAALAVTRGSPGCDLAAAAIFYGAFDVRPDTALGQPLSDRYLERYGLTIYDEAAAETFRSLSPLAFVRPGLPPFLLIHGTSDASVPYAYSTEFQMALREVGVPCDLITIQNGPHGMVFWDKLYPDYKNEVVAWLKQTLAERSGATP